MPCVPGASVESGDDQEFVGRIKVKLGPIEMTYRGTVRMIKRDDVAHEAVLSAAAKEIKGGGSVSATITLRATAAESGSKVTVLSDFSVSGKAAQFGGSVINDVGSKLFREFAIRLATQLESDGVARPPASSESTNGPATAMQPFTAPPSPGKTSREHSQQQEEALNLVSIAWWSVVKRRLVPAALMIALVVWVLLHVFSSRA